MAKYQACKFIRTRTNNKIRKDMLNHKYHPKGYGWEKGIAQVRSFGDGNVEFIIDDTGRKLPAKEVYDWKIINSVAYVAIDTDAVD